jgi:hypothetical protein
LRFTVIYELFEIPPFRITLTAIILLRLRFCQETCQDF